METKKPNGFLRGVVTIGGAIIGYAIVRIIIVAITSSVGGSAPAPAPSGFVISRDNYNTNCVGGIDANTLASVGNDKAVAYCGCTYDEGVANWGGELFTKKVAAISTSNQLTPEFNTIVNDCAGKLNA